VALTTHPYPESRLRRVELHLYSPSGPSLPVIERNLIHFPSLTQVRRFHENPSSGSGVLLCEHVDRRTDNTSSSDWFCKQSLTCHWNPRSHCRIGRRQDRLTTVLSLSSAVLRRKKNSY